MPMFTQKNPIEARCVKEDLVVDIRGWCNGYQVFTEDGEEGVFFYNGDDSLTGEIAFVDDWIVRDGDFFTVENDVDFQENYKEVIE